MTIRPRVRSQALILAAVLAAVSVPTADADDVYLKNGRKFEGVIASVGTDQVTIRMPHGELSLPRGRVLRVEKNASPFEDFLGRKKALQSSTEASAEDWLGLARWAKARNLNQAARDSVLVAAEIDPTLEGLEPLMHAFDFRFDEATGRWIPFDAWMRARGMVQDGGQWITRIEFVARRQAREEALAARRDRQVRDDVVSALAAALQAQAAAAAARDRQEAQRNAPGVAYPYYPVATFPGSFGPLVFVSPGLSKTPPGSLRGTNRSRFTTPRRELILKRDFGGKLLIEGNGRGFEGPPGRIQTRFPQP